VAELYQFEFSNDREEAIAALESMSSGRGWANVAPVVDDDVPDIQVNATGLWVNQGVPLATFVSEAPRRGLTLPSSLGVLHSRGRLKNEVVAGLLGGAPFPMKQNHARRGLLFEVASNASMAQVVEIMCVMTEALCDFDLTNRWRFDRYLRR
jgi:hypothetical protein